MPETNDAMHRRTGEPSKARYPLCGGAGVQRAMPLWLAADGSACHLGGLSRPRQKACDLAARYMCYTAHERRRAQQAHTALGRHRR